jgi:GNAT superfamily N-acetyltransferase
MKINEIITEVFNPETSFPIEWNDKYGPEEMHGRAYDRQGGFIDIKFIALRNGVVEVEFSRNDSYDMTGAGDANRVLATILEAFREYLRGYQPKIFVFSAKGGSRSKVYQNMINRFAAGAGYKQFDTAKLSDKARKQLGHSGSDVMVLRRAAVEEDRHPNDIPYGPETKPTMPKGTVRVDVSDVYDWYKLGTNISNLKDADKSQFGKGPPSTIVSFGDEDTEHKYIKDLEKLGLTTTDIDPVDRNQPRGMKRQKTDPTFNVNEVFNTPYKTKTEKSESGSYDVLAKLPDGTNLSIMFNNEGNDEWQVEFYRNNSQEVTGEGDAQRIFATVLNAIQKFIKKHKPQQLTFSATKDVEPDQNSESRAKLYNRLVDRYATSWGYDALIDDLGDQVSYELTRLQPVTEEEFNGIDITMDVEGDEIMVTATGNGRELGHVLFVDEGEYLMPQDLEVDERFQGQGIAAAMYDYVKSKGYKIRRSGQQTDAGAGFWGKHRPEQNVWENFADGKVKGKSRPGRVKRAGASCNGSVTDLRARAKNASGEKAKMYHWCANMKSGRNK